MAHASTAVIAKVQDLGARFFRQLLCQGTSTAWGEAVDALAPDCKFMGAAGKPSDAESDFRGQIAALRASTRSANCVGITGPNEPNGNNDGFGTGDAAKTVKQMYWIYDETINGGPWTHRAGNLPPPIYSAALKRAGFTGDDDRVYDDCITAMATATYSPGSGPLGGGPLTLNDILVACGGKIDFHRYLGTNPPGLRVNPVDSYGHTPASLTPSPIDGKVTLFDLEVAKANQQAPGVVVGAWTESGWTSAEADPPAATRALYGQETMLRARLAGIKAAFYEMVDEFPYYNGDREDFFGLYSFSTGPKPIYTALKTLWGYTGTTSFAGVGWVEPLGGVNPDCGVVILPKGGGGWDVYLLTNAVTSVSFVTSSSHAVTGRSPHNVDDYGNKRYTIDLSGSTMTVLAVT